MVTLLLHVRWSGPDRSYDLAVGCDRVRVYEQVLSEGTEEDVRTFVDVDQLLDLWDDLLLPARWARRGPAGSANTASSTCGADRLAGGGGQKCWSGCPRRMVLPWRAGRR